MSIEKLSIDTIRDELDSQVRKIFIEFYEKYFQENDAELARKLGISGSTSKHYREGMQIPAWVLLYIWQTAPSLLRDRIIDLEAAKDPCADLSEEEGALVHDFARTLKLRRESSRLKLLDELLKQYTPTELDSALTFIGEALEKTQSAHDLKDHVVTEVTHGLAGKKSVGKSGSKSTPTEKSRSGARVMGNSGPRKSQKR